MKQIAKTEEELRIITWWNGMDGSVKDLTKRLEFGEKLSYKKLNYNQVRTLYKRWN